jgi:hypothetical protein
LGSVATSSTAVDLHWRDRTQLPAAMGRRRGGGGFSGISRPASITSRRGALYLW